MASFESHRNRGPALLSFAVGLLILSAWPSLAEAQQQAQGFAVERFYPSAPGAGWFVMDDRNMSGGLGGAISLTSGYSRNPLVVTSPDGTQRLTLVSAMVSSKTSPLPNGESWSAWNSSVNDQAAAPRLEVAATGPFKIESQALA